MRVPPGRSSRPGTPGGRAGYQEIFNEKGVRFGRAEQVVEPRPPIPGTVDWNQPTFLYLHFMDTHGPYREPDPAVLGPLPAAFAQVRHYDLWNAWEKLKNVSKGDHAFELQYMTASYDSSLHHVDDAVSKILQYYRDHHLLDKTLFVLTADHGEEFLEHGGTTHKGTLFEELVNVPLVIRAPGGLRQTRLPQLVRNFDVHPTILDYAGVPKPAATMDARSLRPLLEGQPFNGPKTVYAGSPGSA